MTEKNPIYLDYNATAPMRPAVRAAMLAGLDCANPSSVHAAGRSARAAVEDARAHIARAIHVKPTQIIFTSGGTESNALALYGLAHRSVLVAATEHDAVLGNAKGAEIIPVDANGIIDLTALENILRAALVPALVCVMMVNNETGVIQPITDIAAICKQHNALLHCDGVQAFGKIPIDFFALGCDSMALSAHKSGGPKGIGALVVRDGLVVQPVWRGGGQEHNRRAGTENIPAIMGFGALAKEYDTIVHAQKEMASLQQHLENNLALINNVTLYGTSAPRAANTTMLTLAGVPSATLLMNLDLAGFAVSSGAACSSGKVKPSHVLTAMGVAPDLAACSLRLSWGWQTQRPDIDGFLAAFGQIAARLHPLS